MSQWEPHIVIKPALYNYHENKIKSLNCTSLPSFKITHN